MATSVHSSNEDTNEQHTQNQHKGITEEDMLIGSSQEPSRQRPAPTAQESRHLCKLYTPLGK
jgi:hypothetical protein